MKTKVLFQNGRLNVAVAVLIIAAILCCVFGSSAYAQSRSGTRPNRAARPRSGASSSTASSVTEKDSDDAADDSGDEKTIEDDDEEPAEENKNIDSEDLDEILKAAAKGAASAKDKRKEDKEAPPRTFTLEPFNSDMERIPDDYWGNHPYLVAPFLIDDKFRFRRRSENLTDKESHDRANKLLKKLEDTDVIGKIKFSSPMALVFRPPFDEDEDYDSRTLKDGKFAYNEVVRTEYSESKQVLTIQKSQGLCGHMPYSKNPPPLFSHECFLKYIERYPVLTPVTRSLIHVKRYETELFGLVSRSRSPKEPFVTIPIEWRISDVSPVDAKRLENKIGVIAVFKLDAWGTEYAGLYEDDDEVDITSDYTSSLESLQYSLCATMLEYWFFNADSGEIIAKLSATDAQRGRAFRYGSAVPKGAITDGARNNGTNDSEESDEDDVDEDDESALRPPTWDDVFNESANEEKTDSWQKKTPAITVPGDAATLAEAIDLAKPGDVIKIAGTDEQPVALGGKKKTSSDHEGVAIDKAIAIVGDFSAPDNAVIEIGAKESILIASKNVCFGGVTFRSGAGQRDERPAPAIQVAETGAPVFKRCAFVAGKASEETGVLVSGQGAAASFWKCAFSGFSSEGIRSANKGKITARYCEFRDGNRYGIAMLDDGTAKITRCLFEGNRAGFLAEGGGGGKVSESFFQENTAEWRVTPASNRFVTATDNYIDGKRGRDRRPD